jgi:hypothetical protein
MTVEEKLRAIKELEEFMVIDDWSFVYMPDLHETLQKIVDNFKDELGLDKDKLYIAEDYQQGGYVDEEELFEAVKDSLQNDFSCIIPW